MTILPTTTMQARGRLSLRHPAKEGVPHKNPKDEKETGIEKDDGIIGAIIRNPEGFETSPARTGITQDSRYGSKGIGKENDNNDAAKGTRPRRREGIIKEEDDDTGDSR